MEPLDLTLEGARHSAQGWRDRAAVLRGDAAAAITRGRIEEAQRLQASAAEYDQMAARAEALTQEQLDIAKKVWDAVRKGEYRTLKEAADVLDPPVESSC